MDSTRELYTSLYTVEYSDSDSEVASDEESVLI